MPPSDRDTRSKGNRGTRWEHQNMPFVAVFSCLFPVFPCSPRKHTFPVFSRCARMTPCCAPHNEFPLWACVFQGNRGTERENPHR